MTNTPNAQDILAGSRTSLRLQIGLAFFAFMAIGMNDGAVGVLLPSMRAHYNIDKGTAGLLFMAGTAGYIITAIVSGLLSERLGRKRYLVLGAGLFMLAATFMSQMPPFVLVLAVLAVLGSGVAVLDTGLNAFAAELPNNRLLLNNLHAFFGVGALIGPLVASAILAVQLGWNSAYFIWTTVGLLLLSGFAVFYSSQNHHSTDHHRDVPAPEGNVLVVALKQRSVWLGGLFLFFYVSTEVTLGSWSYSFLTEDRHGDTLVSGWVVSGYWLGLTLGRLVLARMGQRLGVSSKWLILGCLVGMAVGILLVWAAPVSAASAAGLWLAGFSLGPIYPTTIAVMSQLVHSRLIPSTIGFLTSLGSLGAAICPWLAGNLAERVGLWSLMPFVMALAGIMLLFWLGLARKT